jgi:hypothetical protein
MPNRGTGVSRARLFSLRFNAWTPPPSNISRLGVPKSSCGTENIPLQPIVGLAAIMTTTFVNEAG